VTSRPRIKVLHILHSLSVGGAENGVVNLVNRMDTATFSVGIVTLSPGGKLIDRVDTSRVKLIEELDKQPGNDWRLPFKLAGIFKREKPHIIHTHAWGTMMEGWLARIFAKVPLWIHGEHGTMQEKPLNKRIQRFFWGRADQVLSVSAELANRLSKTMDFSRDKILPILNGVDFTRFNHNELNVKELKDTLKIGENTRVVGIVGRLEPVKDHASFLKAIAFMLKQQTDNLGQNEFCVLVVGDGALTTSLKQLAEKLEVSSVVKFLGRRSDIPQLLRILDIFVCNSLSEGMSNTILEAMASGLPVVATNVGGNPELVIDGETGVLIPSEDPQKLGETLVTLLSDPGKCSEMGRRGKERIYTLFTLERMVKDYENLYQNLCEEKGCLA
jgi:sugar transferase (PEP-CTERM/EpsH1 system associated)